MSYALQSYIPEDRRRALARGETLPEHSRGAVLFADISGFTPLTEAMAQELGPRRGAEELPRQLNLVYDALIAEVERYGGSVVGFAGDAITCWFEEDEGARAVACALAMQDAMAQFATVKLPSGRTVPLAIKVAVATGPVRRFLVGDPTIQLIDVLAGETLTRMATAEHLAQTGEVVVDPRTVAALGEFLQVAAWRSASDGARYAIVGGLRQGVTPAPWPPLPETSLTDERLRPWLLPVVYERLRSGQGEFLTELRPAVALFLRFAGIDYDGDEEAGRKLDAFVRWVQAEGLAPYEGTLIQLTIGEKGSYLYAAFGAPIAHEDDAHRAASAALLLAAPPPHLGIQQVQIGISRGTMRTGAYGGTTRRTYGSLGDEVNLAARLMPYAEPGQILASGRVQAATQSAFDWEALPPIRVKGKEEAIPLFVLLGSAQGQRLQLQEPGYQLPMVGRAVELAEIEAKLALAARGHGQIVGITAEAGMGKSRLVAEVVRAAQAHGFRGVGGECYSYATSSPYLVWQPIWRELFGLEPAEPLPAQVARLERYLRAMDPTLLPRLPLLGSVLNLSFPDSALTASLDPALRKASLEALLVDALRHASRTRPLLLVLEDVHWIDPLSHDLLEAVGRTIGSLPILIVLAYRPPSIARLQSPRVTTLPYFTEIPLREFTPQEAEQLIRAKLARLTSERLSLSPELLQQVMARAQGNPFYIEELLNYLHDRGIDTQNATALAHLELPTSLHSLILSRIDQLEERQQITLKVASILGRLFRAAWLWGYYPALGGPAEVLADLERLSRLDLTPQEAPEPELLYLFKHVVTQEVAYESLSYATRAALHEQFAHYLEMQAASGALRELSLPHDAPLLDLLAYHYERSDNLPKKQVYLRLAGAAAQRAYANEAALDYYERLLPLLDESAPHDQVEIRLSLGAVLDLMGHWEEAERRYQEALEQARLLQESLLEACCERAMGRLLFQRGEWQDALLWQERARATCQTREDWEGVGQALIGIGEVQRQVGSYAEAQAALEQALTYLERANNRGEMANALHHLGIVAWNQGDYPLAQRQLEKSLSLQQALGNKPAIARSLSDLGGLAYVQGDQETALALTEQSLALRRELGDRSGIGACLGNLGLLHYLRKDYQTARTLYEEGMAVKEELGDKRGIAMGLSNLALVAYEEGDPTRATVLFCRSLRVNQELGNRREICGCLVGLARLSDDAARAVRLLAAAHALAEAIGAVFWPAYQHLSEQALAELREQLDDSTFTALWEVGQHLTLEESIAYALEDE